MSTEIPSFYSDCNNNNFPSALKALWIAASQGIWSRTLGAHKIDIFSLVLLLPVTAFFPDDNSTPRKIVVRSLLKLQFINLQLATASCTRRMCNFEIGNYK